MSQFNFGTGKVIAVPTYAANGSLIATPTPVRLGTLQDVSLDISVDIKTLYGANRYPLAVAQGKGKIELKAKSAEINGAVLGSLFFGKTATAGIMDTVTDFPASIPAVSTYTITVAPPNSGTFVTDLGATYAATAQPFTRVATAPAVGQYSVSSGVYTFAAGDAGAAVLLNYEYTATSTTGSIYTINNDLMGTTPSFSILLKSEYFGKRIVVKLNNAVSGKLNLPMKNEDFTVMDFDAQAFADASGNVGYIAIS